MRALLVMLPIALVDVLAPLPDAGALSVRTARRRPRLDALAALAPLVTDPRGRPTAADLSRPEAASERLAGRMGRPAPCWSTST